MLTGNLLLTLRICSVDWEFIFNSGNLLLTLGIWSINWEFIFNSGNLLLTLGISKVLLVVVVERRVTWPRCGVYFLHSQKPANSKVEVWVLWFFSSVIALRCITPEVMKTLPPRDRTTDLNITYPFILRSADRTRTWFRNAICSKP